MIKNASQSDKARAFRAFHQRPSAFIIPNPWDAGSARILEALGFEALATTSAGCAFSKGKLDNTLSREATFEQLAEISSATALPVSADLGNCFGDDPETVAETIKLAAATGIVGGSVEDSTGRADGPIYCFEHAVARVRAAAEAAHSLPFTFTLTARAENYLHGNPDLKDTITRLQAYQEAGADVLFAPGLATKEDIAAVVKSVGRPVNVLMGFQGIQLSLAELAALGVKRVSVGGSLCRAALGALFRAGREMREHGTFTYAAQAASGKELSDIFAP